MSNLINFEGHQIRQTQHNGETYFSIIDVVTILSDSSNSKRYWTDLKRKLNKEGSQVSENIGQLKLPAADGKKYKTDCTNTATIFRIVQSIPSSNGLSPNQYSSNKIDNVMDMDTLFSLKSFKYRSKIKHNYSCVK